MYFIYLDESGTSNLNQINPREESDFFVLGGFMVKEKDLIECNKKFIEFKKKNFPEELLDYPIHLQCKSHVTIFSLLKNHSLLKLEILRQECLHPPKSEGLHQNR